MWPSGTWCPSVSKTQFLHQSTWHNLPNMYPLFFDNTQLLPSTVSIFGQDLSWKSQISSLIRLASLRLNIQYYLCYFFFPSQMHCIYRSLVCSWMEYASHVGELFTYSCQSKVLFLLPMGLLHLTFCRSSSIYCPNPFCKS